MTAAPPSAPAGQEPAVSALRRLVEGRRSIRRYQDRAIDSAVLEDLLTFAMWAPSAHNRQPWRFCVATQADAKERLATMLGARWRRDLEADGAAEQEIDRRIAVSYARITGAPALIVAALDMDEMDAYPDEGRRRAEETMAVQSTALACQNLLLAAHAYGLGACWMCAPLFAPDLVRQALDLPPAWQPQALITLGYPAEEKTSARAGMAGRVLWR